MRSPRALRTGLLLALLAVLATGPVAARSVRSNDVVSGTWDAALRIPSGDVGFTLDIHLHDGKVSGAIMNGPDRQPLTSGTFDGSQLVLRLDYYDGQITARFEDATKTRLVGEYTRQTSKGIGKYEFYAVRQPSAHGDRMPASKTLPEGVDVSGDWIMTLRKSDGSIDEVDEATFTVTPKSSGQAWVSGTVIPVSGDYGLLHGAIMRAAGPGKNPTLRMSRFDGIHVTLLTGEVLADGTMKGEFASGQSYHVTWTAVRKADVASGAPAPEDPFTLTTVKNPAEPFAFSLPDATGKTVSLTDERFKGKVVLVDIFGTWCPNCHDEAPLLVDLYKKYRKDGLEIVLLAYEYTDDAARNARQVEIFRQKYGIDFPILMAGTTADGEIARTLPQLVNFGAYPTTIFIGRDGLVHKIHAGFSGPATGDRFPQVKREFDELVRELLEKK